MTIKSVAYSDISGEPIPDDQHVTVIAHFPDVSFPVRLDIALSESERLADTTLKLVSFELSAPNVPTRSVQVELKNLEKVFPGVSWEDIVAGAPKANSAATPPSQRARTISGSSKPSSTGEKRDYSSVAWAGSVKRGKTSDAEKATVRAHLAEVNKNLEARGERLIDPNIPEHKEKYGL